MYPRGASSGTATLEVGGYIARGPYFKVLTRGPIIESLNPTEGGPGTQVSITGDHFLPASLRAKMAADSTADDSTIRPLSDSLSLQSTTIVPKTADQKTTSVNGLPISVSFGKILASLLSLSDSKIIVEVPSEATSGIITITVGNKTATSTAFNLILPPHIDSFSPQKSLSGTNVAIKGAHFSTIPDSNIVRFNGTTAPVNSAKESQLEVTVPDKATSGPVSVTTRGQTTTGPNFTVGANTGQTLSISNINPKTGPVGTSVTITGSNFSATGDENTVTFNGTEAPVDSATATQLKVEVPQEGTDGPVKVTVGDQTASGPNFNVTVNHPPAITSDAAFDLEENSTAVATITATDSNGDTLTFSLSSGAGFAPIGDFSGVWLVQTGPDDYPILRGVGGQ